MRCLMIVFMGSALFLLASCNGRVEKNTHIQPKANAKLNDTHQPEVIRTEDSLRSLLASIEGGETKKDVTLVGTLKIGDNPKLDPSKLIIGETSVFFGHYVDKEKHDGQTVLVKADIRPDDGKTEDAQVVGHMIVNVKHVEIIKKP